MDLFMSELGHSSLSDSHSICLSVQVAVFMGGVNVSTFGCLGDNTGLEYHVLPLFNEVTWELRACAPEGVWNWGGGRGVWNWAGGVWNWGV